MAKLFIFILFILISYSLQLPNELLNSGNDGTVKRDVSFSYAATDIGTHGGIHVKTLTVIKNIADNTKKNEVESVAKLWENDDRDKINKNEQSNIQIPDIPQTPEELFSEFNLFLNHNYVPQHIGKHQDGKPEINSESNKTENVSMNVEYNPNKELTNEGAVVGEDLFNVNAEEIKESNGNVKNEKLKPFDKGFFISSPILPEHAERSAKAQNERYQAKVIKSKEEPPKELFFPATNIEQQLFNTETNFKEKITPNKNESLIEILHEPNNEKKSEPLLQLPISFDGFFSPSREKIQTKTAYSKKIFQTGLDNKRDGIFIPKFSNSNYKPIKK